jgi:hypothetical protein
VVSVKSEGVARKSPSPSASEGIPDRGRSVTLPERAPSALEWTPRRRVRAPRSFLGGRGGSRGPPCGCGSRTVQRGRLPVTREEEERNSPGPRGTSGPARRAVAAF